MLRKVLNIDFLSLENVQFAWLVSLLIKIHSLVSPATSELCVLIAKIYRIELLKKFVMTIVFKAWRQGGYYKSRVFHT